MSDLEARNAAKKLLTGIQENIYKLSWDDIERLSLDCMEEEPIKPTPMDAEDNIVM